MKVKPKRSRLEVILGILYAALKENRPTCIMYKTGLGWVDFNGYLARMVKMGLLEMQQDGRHRLYFVTEKGKIAICDIQKALLYL